MHSLSQLQIRTRETRRRLDPRSRDRRFNTECFWAVVGMMAIAVAAREWLVRSDATPWIMTDELTYRQLASGISARHLGLHGAVGPFSIYPLLIAPLWRGAVSFSTAYALSRAVNVILMLAVGPIVVIWMRKVVAPRPAVLASGLVLLLPVYVYGGTLLTESLALPTFMLAALAIARMLTAPSVARQFIALAAIGLATASRLESGLLLPIAVTATIEFTLLTRRQDRILYLRRFAPFLLAIGAFGAATFGIAVTRGGSAMVGVYAGLSRHHFEALPMLEAWITQLLELMLAVGLLPVIALGALTLQARRSQLKAEEVALVSVTGCSFVWLTALSGAWTSLTHSGLLERYAFYVEPLLLMVFVIALQSPPVRSPTQRLFAATIVFFPLFLHYPVLLTEGAIANAPSLGGLLWLRTHGSLALSFCAIAAASLLALLLTTRRSRTTWPAVGFVGLVLALNTVASIRLAAAEANRIGLATHATSWVDDAVSPGTSTAVLFSGNVDPMLLWQAEFWNRSVDRRYYIRQRLAGSPASQPVRVDNTGHLTLPNGQSLHAQAIATDSTIAIHSPVLAQLNNGLTLYRYTDKTTVEHIIDGLYPNSLTHQTITYEQPNCTGTTNLIFTFIAPASSSITQIVTARQAGSIVARQSLPPNGTLYLRAPLRETRGSCKLTISFTHPPTQTTTTPGAIFSHVIALPA